MLHVRSRRSRLRADVMEGRAAAWIHPLSAFVLDSSEVALPPTLESWPWGVEGISSASSGQSSQLKDSWP